MAAVDGAKNCGPADINDGFDKVNVYFSYNSDINLHVPPSVEYGNYFLN
jgi:hypothetical protein